MRRCAGRLARRLQRHGRVARIVDAPAERLPLADASVDTVVSTLVLCTVPDPERTLSEIARVLRPDGQLLFIEHVRAKLAVPRGVPGLPASDRGAASRRLLLQPPDRGVDARLRLHRRGRRRRVARHARDRPSARRRERVGDSNLVAAPGTAIFPTPSMIGSRAEAVELLGELVVLFAPVLGVRFVQKSADETQTRLGQFGVHAVGVRSAQVVTVSGRYDQCSAVRCEPRHADGVFGHDDVAVTTYEQDGSCRAQPTPDRPSRGNPASTRRRAGTSHSDRAGPD